MPCISCPSASFKALYAADGNGHSAQSSPWLFVVGVLVRSPSDRRHNLFVLKLHNRMGTYSLFNGDH